MEKLRILVCGGRHKYDISSRTELIIKRCKVIGPFSAFMEWSKKERRFKF